MEFDLLLENIPFLVDERDHNIEAIESKWQKLKYWKQTYRKTIWTSNNIDKDTSEKDFKIIITDITNNISDLIIRNMKIDDLIWQKNLMMNNS